MKKNRKFGLGGSLFFFLPYFYLFGWKLVSYYLHHPKVPLFFLSLVLNKWKKRNEREREKRFSLVHLWFFFFFLYFSQRNRFLYFGSFEKMRRSVGLWPGMLMSSEGARAKAQWRKRIVMTGPAELSSSRCKEPKRRRRRRFSLFLFLVD